MKTPHLRELKQLNKELRSKSASTYRRVLGVAITQYTRISGDGRPLGYLRSRSWRQLYELADALSATQYSDAALHFAAHQLAALIRKYPWTRDEIPLDPEAEALRSFHASEHRCKWMNRWAIASYRRNVDREDLLVSRMKAWIRMVIGSRPNLPRIYAQCDFSAGASVGVHGNATNLQRKLLAEKWSVSPSALPYFAAALCHQFQYATRVAKGNEVVQSFHVSCEDVKAICELVSYNKIAFVNKTAKTHRGIAVEPLGNGFIQKGTDQDLKHSLRKVGINLRDQSLNQRMAYEGSLDDSEEGFCTIDLKDASNSVYTELVRLTFPPDWFNFLNRTRSPSYRLPDGTIHRYEKFCSMGNGFCFPLETLIFAGAVHAVCGGVPGVDWSVYGDDIVVRKKHFTAVLSLLKRLGFKPNLKKTFGEGPFRESCGSNWYQGRDVTPFTLDFKLESLSSLFKAINLMRRNERTTWFFREVVGWLINRIPLPWRFFRPYPGPEDSAIDFGDLQFLPNWRWDLSFQRPKWLELKMSPVKDALIDPALGWVVNAAALRGHPSDKPFALRRQVETRVRVVPARRCVGKRTAKMSEMMDTHPDVGPSPL